MPSGRPAPPRLRDGLLERIRTGFAANLELEILELSGKLVRVSMAVTDRVRQGLGLVHGGALATLGDIAATLGAYASAPADTDHVTSHLATDYLGPVRGGPVVAEARPLKAGQGRLSTWEVRILGPRGELAAFVTATLAAVPLQGRRAPDPRADDSGTETRST